MTVLIAGGGIAGLALGLTLHQIGVPFHIFERASEMKPLGVGINVQPNAVRELYEMGLEDALSKVGVKTREYGMFTKHGLEIWTEPRGIWAGYHWPQYSVHRGELTMLLYHTLLDRAGADCITLGAKALGFDNGDDGVRLHLLRGGEHMNVIGDVLIAADGIHSAIRTQMAPDEGPPIWNGAVLWRGTSLGKPFRTGASMALIGHATQRIVSYPITAPDPDTGEAVMNWIAELWFDPSKGWEKNDWNREASLSDFLPQFYSWVYDWYDFPALMEKAEKVFEYPMVDRDPLPRWTRGRTTLMGDAAHATYPVGSNGASTAIIDARKIGRAFLEYGVNSAALEAYEAEMRPAMQKLIETNRGSGPDAVLQMMEDKCRGMFENLEDVVSREELAHHAETYKAVAGFSIEALNNAPSIVPKSVHITHV
ncbi:flavin-dependent oxidoreductase [Pseudahrensia aquimaris]|uniref:Flavin-dependent oxidoreductase n=1 Tax=Pseudahrensia aquimaris TaxID=744461 RepID=A0ABW3FEK4_9HYPH